MNKNIENYKSKLRPTLGDFLSVLRLTKAGLSYLTNDAFGGIISAT